MTLKSYFTVSGFKKLFIMKKLSKVAIIFELLWNKDVLRTGISWDMSRFLKIASWYIIIYVEAYFTIDIDHILGNIVLSRVDVSIDKYFFSATM